MTKKPTKRSILDIALSVFVIGVILLFLVWITITSAVSSGVLSAGFVTTGFWAGIATLWWLGGFLIICILQILDH